jgi:hypothetical protein
MQSQNVLVRNMRSTLGTDHLIFGGAMEPGFFFHVKQIINYFVFWTYEVNNFLKFTKLSR